MKSFANIIALAAIIGGTAVAQPAETPAQPAAAAATAFLVSFKAYDGDPPMTFQINAVGPQPKTEFLKLGERVTGSRFKLSKFTYKTRRNEKRQEDEDVSELTLVNVETGKSVVLTLGSKPTDVSAVK